MTTSALATLLALPAELNHSDGPAFGMKKAMLLMALVAGAILLVAILVGNARAKRKPPTPPTYPILEPPHGRGSSQDRSGQGR